jgi:kinetochore protein Mis13/DSN1
MTTLIARQPLQTLSMSSSQRGPRRLSARLQEKEDAQPHTNGYHLGSKNQTLSSTTDNPQTRRGQDKPPATKKRRIGESAQTFAGWSHPMGRRLTENTEYDEDEDGFVFTRARARKPRPSTSKITSIPEQAVAGTENGQHPEANNLVQRYEEPDSKEPSKKRRTRMSFSTPNVRPEKPVRRSKRLSDEPDRRDGSPQPKARRKDEAQAEDAKRPQEVKRPPEQDKTPLPSQADVEGDPSATKIALPFADTPVIRKNRAMRERKSGKGERRSSLGLRGRRASSLIDTGNSNGEHIEPWIFSEVGSVLIYTPALPHSEVEIADFYKHIESEGLPEPRRMRQLLTWCATRAMGEQLSASPHAHPEYDEQSARLAGEHRSASSKLSSLTASTARVIQEELLKDFANRSDMSDWFGREDAQQAGEPLPVKPNPKNVQNAAKIDELEAQIRRYTI